jgi:hypothetical protein
MKLRWIFLALLCGLGFVGKNIAAQDEAEKETQETPPVYTVVKVIDIDGVATFSMLLPDELKTLTKSVDSEEKALDRAYNNLKDDWKKKHAPSTQGGQAPKKKVKIPDFPLKRPNPKSLKTLGKFPSEAAADEAQKQYEAREAERAQKLQELKDKAQEKEDKEREKMAAMASTPAGLSAPKAPMATPHKTDDIDPEVRQQLIEDLKKEIAFVAAGGSDRHDNDSKPSSSGARKIVLKKGKVLGDGATTPLVDNPTTMK